MSFGVPRRSRLAMSSPVSFAPLRTIAALQTVSLSLQVSHIGDCSLEISSVSRKRNAFAALLSCALIRLYMLLIALPISETMT